MDEGGRCVDLEKKKICEWKNNKRLFLITWIYRQLIDISTTCTSSGRFRRKAEYFDLGELMLHP